VKESDRLAVMSEGLTAMGVVNELTPDGIRIEGGRRLTGGRITCHGDHRIAMAFTVASLISDGPIQVQDVANVDTSFPGFVEVARQAGLAIEAV
jgi:3-phosphoshikimate 1-carboxyvinyltransferase